MPFGIGVWELVALAIVLLLLFGSKQLPGIAKQLGKNTRKVGKEVAEMKSAFTVELGDVSDGDEAKAASPAEQLELPKPELPKPKAKPKPKRAAVRRR